MKKVCLVSCVKTKLNKRSIASELYISPLFKKSKAYAEFYCDTWKILSAKHGLVDPSEQLDPYSETLNHLSEESRKSWAYSVFIKLRPLISQEMEFVILAGVNYRKHLVPLLRDAGALVYVPMESMSLGNQLKWLSKQMEPLQVSEDIRRFYELLQVLEQGFGGKIPVHRLTKNSGIPDQGLYFFFEQTQFRNSANTELRVVRVGTHGVSKGSSSTLWSRIKTHKGDAGLGGNHRGSVFRLHLGRAFINRSNSSLQFPNWGIGQSATSQVTSQEKQLEKMVSEYIEQMSVLYVSVPGESNAFNDRAFLERNIIGLLSSNAIAKDNPTRDWLGNFSDKPLIRESGLWNIAHVGSGYDRRFLDILERYIHVTLGNLPPPVKQLAPKNWHSSVNSKKKAFQMDIWEN